eukprot:403369745
MEGLNGMKNTDQMIWRDFESQITNILETDNSKMDFLSNVHTSVSILHNQLPQFSDQFVEKVLLYLQNNLNKQLSDQKFPDICLVPPAIERILGIIDCLKINIDTDKGLELRLAELSNLITLQIGDVIHKLPFLKIIGAFSHYHISQNQKIKEDIVKRINNHDLMSIIENPIASQVIPILEVLHKEVNLDAIERFLLKLHQNRVQIYNEKIGQGIKNTEIQENKQKQLFKQINDLLIMSGSKKRIEIPQEEILPQLDLSSDLFNVEETIDQALKNVEAIFISSDEEFKTQLAEKICQTLVPDGKAKNQTEYKNVVYFIRALELFQQLKIGNLKQKADLIKKLQVIVGDNLSLILEKQDLINLADIAVHQFQIKMSVNLVNLLRRSLVQNISNYDFEEIVSICYYFALSGQSTQVASFWQFIENKVLEQKELPYQVLMRLIEIFKLKNHKPIDVWKHIESLFSNQLPLLNTNQILEILHCYSNNNKNHDLWSEIQPIILNDPQLNKDHIISILRLLESAEVQRSKLWVLLFDNYFFDKGLLLELTVPELQDLRKAYEKLYFDTKVYIDHIDYTLKYKSKSNYLNMEHHLEETNSITKDKKE